MPAYALTAATASIRGLEAELRCYLPGLDVRLEQYSPRQAVLAGHLMTALQREYTAEGAAAILGQLGVARASRLDDAEVVAVLRARDVRDLEPRAHLAPRARGGLDWHLEKTRTDQAWDLLNGPDGIDWRGICVGQIDTGYTPHPAFGFPRPWLDTANGRTFKAAPPPDGPTEPAPEPGAGLDPLSGVNGGHGTKMGSTIAGRAASDAFHGVAPKCPLVPVRICDVVLITDRPAQQAFEEAVEHLLGIAGMKAINVSLGVFPALPIKAMRRAVDAAYEAGVIMVCAAGNHTGANVVAPASLSRTLAIGGVTADDSPWSGSSHGPQVDLSAPAADMRSAAARRGGFDYVNGGNGTSYATAMVSGAAALWHALHRDALAREYDKPWHVVEAFKLCARSTARKPPGWNGGAFGEGILDVLALLEAPLPAAALLHEDDASV